MFQTATMKRAIGLALAIALMTAAGPAVASAHECTARLCAPSADYVLHILLDVEMSSVQWKSCLFPHTTQIRNRLVTDSAFRFRIHTPIPRPAARL